MDVTTTKAAEEEVKAWSWFEELINRIKDVFMKLLLKFGIKLG